MLQLLSKLDLVFCIDLTSSMSGFIAAAKHHMTALLEGFAAQLDGGLRVAIVGYRDHCDGDRLLEVYPLEADLAKVAAAIRGLAVSGGGDAPEAVYTGLDACLALAWAPGSYRVILLVGDAPPHGVGCAGDSLPHDPTGYTIDDMANKLETEGVFVHALSMRPGDALLARSFQRLSISTGGGFHDTSSSVVMAIVDGITRSLLADIDLDRKVLARLHEGVVVPAPVSEDDRVPSRAELLAKALRVEERDIHAAIMRLRRRRLLALDQA